MRQELVQKERPRRAEGETEAETPAPQENAELAEATDAVVSEIDEALEAQAQATFEQARAEWASAYSDEAKTVWQQRYGQAFKIVTAGACGYTVAVPR
jgi:hypothetical protein